MVDILATEIARFLNLELVHGESRILRADDILEAGPGGMIWLKQYDPQRVLEINKARPSLVICDQLTSESIEAPCIVSSNPKMSFLKTLEHYFRDPEPTGIHPTAIIESGVRLAVDVAIGAYTRIGGNVSVGPRTIIGSGVVIEGRVSMGSDCRVKSNSVIGSQGFTFERDENGNPHHFPHIGCIVIGNDVWIGSCTTIERGGLGSTTIQSGVKIDDLVQIGHNTFVGKNTLIMANMVLCGGASIGENCWLAPNSVVKQKVHVGNDCVVGLGAVVLKDVPNGATVAGVPARVIC